MSNRAPFLVLLVGLGLALCLLVAGVIGAAMILRPENLARLIPPSNTPGPATATVEPTRGNTLRTRVPEPTSTPRPSTEPEPTRTPRPLNPTITPTPAFAEVVIQFFNAGDGPSQFNDARYVAVDWNNQLYVGEYESGRVQWWEDNNLFAQGEWEVEGETPLRGLDASPDGLVYAVRDGDILVYEGITGELLDTLDSATGDRYDDVAVLPDGNLLVFSFVTQDELLILSPEGAVLERFPEIVSAETGKAELIVRVGTDVEGNLYALSLLGATVLKFSPEGKFLQKFGAEGDGPGQFRLPTAFAVDEYGRVFINALFGIQVFNAQGEFIEKFAVDGVVYDLTFGPTGDLYAAAGDGFLILAIQEP
jgi:hypothetical protein